MYMNKGKQNNGFNKTKDTSGEKDLKRKSPVDTVKDIILAWPLKIKIGAGIFLVLLLIGGFLLQHYYFQNEFISIYSSELSPAEVDMMSEILLGEGYRQGVQFEVEKLDKGSNLLAQRKLVGIMREKLAKEGFPREKMVIPETSITMTESEREKVSLLETEKKLADQIRMMEGINYAAVFITPAEFGLFESEDRPAKAAVNLSLKKGYSLNSGQTKSIMNIVSSAIQGLMPEQVSVSDVNGRNYSEQVVAQYDKDGNIPVDVKDAKQKDLQDELACNAQQILDNILGYGNSKVTVNVMLNFDGMERSYKVYGKPGSEGKVENYCGNISNVNENVITIGGRTCNVGSQEEFLSHNNGSYIVSGQKVTEKYDNENPSSDTDNNGKSNYVKDEEMYNFAIDETSVRVVQSPGKIERLTVGLALDNVPDKYIKEIESVVAATVGLDASRGDVICVTNIPFNRNISEGEVILPPAAPASGIIDSGSYNIAAVSILSLAIVLALIYIAKKNKSDREKKKLELTFDTFSSYEDIIDNSNTTTKASLKLDTPTGKLKTWAGANPKECAFLLKNSWLKA